MKARIVPETDISFPVLGEKDQKRYGGMFSFSRLVDAPGVALLVRGDPDFSVAWEFSLQIFSCWPMILMMIALATLAGAMMWILVST